MYELRITGSPPQVRGKRWGDSSHAPIERITPAGAGKTEFANIYNHLQQDHPRRCGENFRIINIVQRIKGSPPQVRGKPVDLNEIAQKIGITPAGAGKTYCKFFFSR